MSKQYKLLKDLPTLKAGDDVIFKKGDDISYPSNREYSYCRDGRRWYLSPLDVENNPEWFEEIRVSNIPIYPEVIFEEKGNTLVASSFVRIYREGKWYKVLLVEKTSPFPGGKRPMTAGDILLQQVHKSAYEIIHLYQLCGLEELDTDQRSEHERLQDSLPKYAVGIDPFFKERVETLFTVYKKVNSTLVAEYKNRPAEKEKPKEWEIVDGMMSADPQGFARIKSVKRLSDGEVFTVGDYTCDGYIKGFEIRDDKMRVLYPAIGDWQFLPAVSKQKPQPKKERIEVLVEQVYGNLIQVNSRLMIPEDKLPAIKSAIEGVLNDDVFDAKKINDRIKQLEAVEERERLAFEAGREQNSKTYGAWQFQTFSDYKNRKQ